MNTPNVDWRTNIRDYPGRLCEDPFEIANSALIIVDMQRYWTEPDGPTGKLLKKRFPEILSYFYGRLGNTVIPSLVNVLSIFRRLEKQTFFITTGSVRADLRDLSLHSHRSLASSQFQLLQVGSYWHGIDNRLSPLSGEFVLNKTSTSALNSTNIEQLLRNLGIDNLLFGGFSTNGCVDLTARDAADLGYRTFLLEDGCVAFTEDEHFGALRNFQRIYGPVISAEDVVQSSLIDIS